MTVGEKIMMRTWIAFAVLSVLTAATAHAQHPNLDRGFRPESVYQFDGIESVSPLNGNLSLTIPIGQTYNVNGNLAYSIMTVANSKVWDLETKEEDLPGGGKKKVVEAIPTRMSNVSVT